MDGVSNVDICTACRRPRAERGCEAGRCFSPRARADELPQTSPRPRPAPRGPLGPRRKVIAAELRESAAGALFWVLQLECACRIWYPAGRNPKPAKKHSVCTVCGEKGLRDGELPLVALALAVAVVVLPDLARLLDLTRSPGEEG